MVMTSPATMEPATASMPLMPPANMLPMAPLSKVVPLPEDEVGELPVVDEPVAVEP